ncbi:hypothetical protein FQZ97_796670 [compost metagenome]
MLKDAEIRNALVAHLNSRSPKPDRIVEELHVHNGNAIADVVALYKKMHCYEIKGETDSIQRILKQAEVYAHSFPKLTLVLTAKHVRWSLRNLPAYWGIMVASRQNERVIFNYERRALNNPDFTTSKALMMLWRQELLDVSERMGVRQKKAGNRSDFAKLLSEHVNKEDALEQIQGAILQRFSALLPHT